MHALVVAGGELLASHTAELSALAATADLVVAADRGLDHCRAVSVWPDVLVGDLDSASRTRVDQAVTRGVEVVEFSTDKDATDLELAIDLAIERGARQVTVYAVYGGRIDHELATIGLLTSPRWSEIDICGCDGRRSLWVVRRSVTLHERIGQTLSLVPWNDVGGVTTQGMRWPLQGELLAQGSTRGVSNICDHPEQTISVESGTLLVVVDRAP